MDALKRLGRGPLDQHARRTVAAAPDNGAPPGDVAGCGAVRDRRPGGFLPKQGRGKRNDRGCAGGRGKKAPPIDCQEEEALASIQPRITSKTWRRFVSSIMKCPLPRMPRAFSWMSSTVQPAC